MQTSECCCQQQPSDKVANLSPFMFIMLLMVINIQLQNWKVIVQPDGLSVHSLSFPSPCHSKCSVWICANPWDGFVLWPCCAQQTSAAEMFAEWSQCTCGEPILTRISPISFSQKSLKWSQSKITAPILIDPWKHLNLFKSAVFTVRVSLEYHTSITVL